MSSITSKNKEIIFSIILIVIMVAVVGYNVSSVEYQKIEVREQAKEAARMERERLEKIKSQETKEIAEFDQEYGKLKDEFAAEVDELSEKLYSKISSIDELKELTTQRIDASKKLKENLSQMDIPGPLENYYKLEMEFLDSDIETMTLVLDYYNGSNYSAYDDERLDEAYRESSFWFQKAEEEIDRVYREYNLEYLLEESS